MGYDSRWTAGESRSRPQFEEFSKKCGQERLSLLGKFCKEPDHVVCCVDITD